MVPMTICQQNVLTTFFFFFKVVKGAKGISPNCRAVLKQRAIQRGPWLMPFRQTFTERPPLVRLVGIRPLHPQAPLHPGPQESPFPGGVPSNWISLALLSVPTLATGPLHRLFLLSVMFFPPSSAGEFLLALRITVQASLLQEGLSFPNLPS